MALTVSQLIRASAGPIINRYHKNYALSDPHEIHVDGGMTAYCAMLTDLDSYMQCPIAWTTKDEYSGTEYNKIALVNALLTNAIDSLTDLISMRKGMENVSDE